MERHPLTVAPALCKQLYESVGKSLPEVKSEKAHEVAQACLFLMQEGFSTGQTVVVDSGTILV